MLIELKAVTKDFVAREGAVIRALGPIDLVVPRKSFVALVGPSGCGKSTVLNIVAGLAEPTSGTAHYDGIPVASPNRRVGYMTQKDTLLPWRTVLENVVISLELKQRATSKSERTDRAAKIIETVGLKGFEHHYPSELSGGMRKRAALARMLIYEPETLLLDEPFGALDAQLKIVMQQELLRLVQDRQMTTIFVTHDLEEAILLADKVIVFTSRPGQIKTERDIPFARPREVEDFHFRPEFGELHRQLWSELKAEVARGTDL
jgi:NitT/TauT family transport system ATP-binding protein